MISTITEEPVRIVINSEGQDHRWLGNSCFKAKGARIIASIATVADQGDRFNRQSQGLEPFVFKDGSKTNYGDKTFVDSLSFKFSSLHDKMHTRYLSNLNSTSRI